MRHSIRLFIFAGEVSGDSHGASLVKALKEKKPNIVINGVAGPKLRKEGITGPFVMENFEVMGFTDVILSLPRLIKQFYVTRNYILKENPDAVILIDYPGFNLRMAKALREKKYQGKIIQYISPSVWAWGAHRIIQMEKTLDLLMTIYPFEGAFFSHTSLKINYVGSPVKEQISQYKYNDQWQDLLNIPKDKNLIALFPGSRLGEIKQNLKLMLEAAILLKQEHPSLIFGISCTNEKLRKEIKDLSVSYPILEKSLFFIPKPFTYELMREAYLSLAKSGTVTLELALHNCPTVVIYKLSLLNKFLAKYIFKPKSKYYCMANILAGKEIFPELIENQPTAPLIFDQLNLLYTDEKKRNSCIDSTKELIFSIGTSQSSENGASAIWDVVV